VTEIRTAAPVLAGPRRGAAAGSALVGLGLAAVLLALPFHRAVPVWAGLATFAATAAIVLDRVAIHHPFSRFGVGNTITLLRAAGAALLVAVAFEPSLLDGEHAWLALGGVVLLLALDGVDGRIARNQELTSGFGARFDMEVDALLILALSALALGTGKAGAWVLGIGLMRYAFVAAGRLWPALARPLPPSRRRAVVCGLQVAALGLLLAPPVVPPSSSLIAGLAFALLAGSFAIDTVWLLRHRR
jgi:phosphatidylglycerophosphate synthase